MNPLPLAHCAPLRRLIFLTEAPSTNSRASRKARIWTCTQHSPRNRNTLQTLTSRSSSTPTHRSSFHTSSRLSSDNDTNHYTTLAISSTASPAEIKRQFYSLSKTHHPDRNPDDPTASTRFVAISEAYHVLSVPEKRAQYDAHLSQTQGQGSRRWGAVWRGGEGDRPQGSYSSASFAGSRPASGLNKKRTTFRGPPPSFYKSGGYGKHGAKRGEYAYHQHEGERSAGQESYGGFEGFGPGQTGQGNEVPHFDDKRHKKTHDHVNDHIYARRRRTRASDIPDDVDRGGQLASFVLVAGTVGVIAWSAKVLGEKTEKKGDKT